MARIRRSIVAISLPGALVGLWGMAPPAWAIPAMPPGVGWRLGVVAACPLHATPGDAIARVPHPAPPPAEQPGGLLVDASGTAALVEARGWIRVGRPADALAALAAAPADDPRARLYRLAAYADLERWEDLGAELERIPSDSLPVACGAIRTRWVAETASATGDTRAQDAWEALARERPELGAYLDLWRLEAAASGGRSPEGLAAWDRLAASDLPARARDRGRAALALLHERAGRLAEARGLHLALAGSARGGARAGHWLAAARLADASGRASEADDLRRRAVAEEPRSATAVLLDPELRARLRLPPIELARALLRAGRPAEAEPVVTGALASGAGTATLQEGTLLRAKIREAAGDLAGADADYASYLSRWPTDPRAVDVLLDRGRLAYRNGQGQAARALFQEVLVRYPSSGYADDALYLLADSWQDDYGSDAAYAERAIEAFDRLVRTWPGSYFADRAQMRAAHLAFALGRHEEARRRYAAYRGGESAREARYWQARALEALGRNAEAREILRELAAGGDWYALLARDRLGGRPGASLVLENTGYREGPAPSLSDGAVLREDPAGRTAGALLEFGERELAGDELARGLARVGGDRDRLAAWADALVAWGFPGLALRIGAGLGENGAGRAWAYPRGHAAGVDAESRAHGLDAYYVLALIRQESLFDADAVSPVGAVGLMQIMPATGQEIADSTGWADYDPALLTDPAISLHFGASYLEEQLVRFDGFWPAVLAAYNGGPQNVARWWEFPERRLDPELWIDRIPFRETRNYVKRIVAQYLVYRGLHADAPASR